MQYSRLIAVRCIVIPLVFLGSTAQAADHVALELKWFTQFQFAGYYAALEKNYYAEEGLDVEIHERDPSKNPIDLVLDGKSQFGISDASLVLHRLRGRRVVALAAVFQHSPLVLLTRAKDNILGPLELKGKRVMRQKGIDDAAITAMFDLEGITDADVIDIPHNYDDEALLKGQADAMSAYLTNQPFLYERKGVPIRIIKPLNYGVDFYGDMLFTSETLMRNRPDLALKFRRASMKGWDYALKHPDEVITWLIEKYGAKKSREHLQFEARAIKKMILPELVEIGSLNSERFRHIANIYRAQKLAPLDAQVTGVDYRDYLQRDTSIPKWVQWLVGAVFTFAILSVLLFFINRRLNKMVGERTQELQAARDSLQQYVDIVDKHIITSSTDRFGLITNVSEAFAKISKFDKEELLGRNHNIVRHPDMPGEIYNDLWVTILSGKSWSGEIKNRAKDGSAYWVEVNVEPDFDSGGEITGFTAIRYDITDKKRIEELSVTDSLTKLYNRGKLDEAFSQEVERFKRFSHPLSFILFDIDHFKKVNDTFGHTAGDDVLVGTAELIRENVRTTDIAGRWGGEEFLIICPETDSGGANVLAEKLRAIIEARSFPQVGQITASFGLATAKPEDEENSLLQRADKALYRAKEAGRNRVEFSD